MRISVRALVVAVLAPLAATACNVTPQEISASQTQGGNSNSGGASTSSTRGPNNSSSSSSGNGSSSSSSSGGTIFYDGGPATGIEFIGTTNPFLGVNYQAAFSVTPINTFNFHVASATDGGVPNVAVTFAPGSSNAQGSTLLDSGGNAAQSVTVNSNAAGLASVQVQSGTQAGQVTVTATITLASGATANATGSSSVVGTQPSVKNSGISCGKTSATITALENLAVYSGGNVPCATKSTYTGTTTCTVTLGDRFGNAIGVAVPVHFYAEAGLWQSQTASTPAYSATLTTPGIATNTLTTQNAGLPQDVPPLAATGLLPAEPSYNGVCLGTARTFNPRDGLVTIMAAFTGEEKFDITASSTWQQGIPFNDLPQPFVDNDDSSTWKAGDICAGTSTAGVCDGPNHMWDGNADVWVETWVLYSGDPTFTTWIPDAGPNVVTNAAGQVLWSDINLNLPPSETTCTLTSPSSGNPTGFTSTYQGTASPADGLGMSVAQVELCDAGYVIGTGGTQMAQTVCAYQTVVTGFSGGFAGAYSLAQGSFIDGGAPYCIDGNCTLFKDTPADDSSLCGTAFGPGKQPGGSSSGGTTSSSSSSSSSSSGSSSSGSGAPDSGPLVVGGIQFLSVDYPNPLDPFMGVDYQTNYTINPVAQFIFQVQDPTGKKGVPNTEVTFSIDSATLAIGAYLVSTSQCTVGSPCLSDSNGDVVIALHSGHGAGGVTVTGSVTLSDGSTANAQGVSNVVGTQPSVNSSSISCSPKNLAAFVGGNLPCNTQTTENFGSTCTVNLADRFHNAIGVQVSVQFYTEAGNWQSAVVNTPTYGTKGVPPGVATNQLLTTGSLPEDVPPLTSVEPSYSGTCAGVARTFNPRDGLVTIIAVFTGEEPFSDNFATGSWVPGDPWVDMAQPFVDTNDNSVWDPGEQCVGAAGPGGCAGPNHIWDGNNPVFVEGRILYGGDPIAGETAWEPVPGIPEANPTNGFTVSKSSPWLGQILWPDINLNVPPGAAGMFTNYGVTVFGSSCTSAPSVSYEPPGGSWPGGGPGDELGMNFNRFGLPNSGNPDCDAGYYISDAGADVANPYCTFLTVISGFSGGFLGSYEVTESATCLSCTPVPPATSCTPPPGTVTVQATAQSSLDTSVDRVTLQGAAQ